MKKSPNIVSRFAIQFGDDFDDGKESAYLRVNLTVNKEEANK